MMTIPLGSPSPVGEVASNIHQSRVVQMLRTGLAAAALLGMTIVAAVAGTSVLTVGPSGQYATIAAAVAVANADTNSANSYVISVAAGTYSNDTAQINRPMTIEAAVPGSAVILYQSVALANEKGILLAYASLTVDGLTFENAEISNSLGGNGAGIRDQDTNTTNDTLTVMNSTFINNQMGILTENGPTENTVLINDVFINNGNPNANYFGHAVYIGSSGWLTAIGNEACGTNIGHDIKSRASMNVIENNTLYDGAADPNQPSCNVGSTSYALDLPNGGVALVADNTMIQGTATENSTIFAYGEEGLIYPTNSITFMNNVMDNTLTDAIGIYDNPSAPVPVVGSGNTFANSIATQVDPASANQLTGSVDAGGSISPDGSTLVAPSTGSLTTAAGVWTFGAPTSEPGNYYALLNGTNTNGWVSLMEVDNGGQLYVYNSGAEAWWIWNNGWSPSAAP